MKKTANLVYFQETAPENWNNECIKDDSFFKIKINVPSQPFWTQKYNKNSLTKNTNAKLQIVFWFFKLRAT